jgi:hypothetical protein
MERTLTGSALYYPTKVPIIRNHPLRSAEAHSRSSNSSGGPAARAAFTKAASHRLTAFSGASAPWSTVSTIFSLSITRRHQY